MHNNDFPQIIEIQTSTFCNGKCVICPHHNLNQNLSGRIMPTNLFKKIIAECKEHSNVIKRIIPYFNNEPFLDKRIIDLLRFVKAQIKAEIEISSNLSYVTQKQLEAIVKENLIDEFRISFFGADRRSYTKIMTGLDFETSKRNLILLLNLIERHNPGMELQVCYVLYPQQDEKFHQKQIETLQGMFGRRAVIRIFGYLDRVGTNRIKNKLRDEHHKGKLIGCNLDRPFERLNIYYDGRAVLCSQDWQKETNLGNVSPSSLREIWKGSEFNRIRRQILGIAPSGPDFVCRRCKCALFEKDNEPVLNSQEDFKIKSRMAAKERKFWHTYLTATQGN